jgi:prepilin-type N-terminal cleavage/methylation domain-containing protein
MKGKNFKLNQVGFTLMEVVISVAIIGGLALVTMQLMNVQVGVKTASDINEDLVIMSSQVISFLNDSESCSQTLAQVPIVINGTERKSPTISMLNTANGRTIIETGKSFASSDVQIDDIFIDAEIDDPYLSTSVYHMYRAELVVVITKTPQGVAANNAPGVRTISKKFPILLDYSIHQAFSMVTTLGMNENYVKEKLFEQCKADLAGANFIGHDVYKVFCNNKNEGATQTICTGVCQVKNTADIKITRCL